MARPLWLVELIKKTFGSRFTLARLTKAPVVGSVIDTMLFGGDDIIYLPRDNVIRIDQALEKPPDVVLPSAVVEHFIEEAHHHLIMNFCICRASNDCQEYPTEYGCIFLGEAVHKIHPKLGRLVDKQEALDHLHRCQEAGLVHLIGRNKLDTAWLGATPGNKLLTICNCCPCCCLWKMLPDVDAAIAGKITAMPGVSVTVTDACKGCKLCTRDVCFVGAIQMEGKRAVIDSSLCRGCGRCVECCPLDAIELHISDASFVEASIARISPLVDLS